MRSSLVWGFQMVTPGEWRKVLVGAVLGTVLGFGFAHSQATRDIHPTAIRDASLTLHPQENGRSVGQGSGTAWSVDGTLKVTTAAHVVSHRQFVVGVHDRQRRLFQVVYVNRRSDFAILEPVESDPGFEIDPLPFKLGDTEFGDPVWYAGTPNGNPHLILHGHYAGDVYEHGVRYQVFDSFAWKGSSGSAVVDRRGGFLGSVSRIDVDDLDDAVVLIPNLVFASLETEDIKTLTR